MEREPTTSDDLSQSKFLAALGYNFNVTKASQTTNIKDRGSSHIESYEEFQTHLHQRINAVLEERVCLMNSACVMSQMDGSVLSCQAGLVEFHEQIKDVMRKSTGHIAQLQSMVRKAESQEAAIVKTIKMLMSSNVQGFNALVPGSPMQQVKSKGRLLFTIQVESTFSPGQKIVIGMRKKEGNTRPTNNTGSARGLPTVPKRG